MLKTLKILIAVIMLLSVAAPAFAAESSVVDNSQRIKAKELKALIDKGETIMIVDVRSPDEFDKKHITGALSVPIHEIGNKLAGLPQDTKIAFY